MFDTHVHFDAFDKEIEPASVLERARAAGVMGIIAVGGDEHANEQAVVCAAAHSHIVRGATVGYSRELAEQPPPLARLKDMAAAPSVKAVGEIGLDFVRSRAPAAAQMALFDSMLDLALELELPVVVHSRGAEKETLLGLRRFAAARGQGRPPGVLHCFTGSAAFAEELLALGFYLSFSGIITFGNATELRPVAAMTPAEKLLLETDSPYLAPEPYRGRQNEPAYLPHIAEAVARLRSQSLASIVELTTANAEFVFNL